MNIIEKSAYIKGLAEGLNYDKNSAEGKLIAALIELTGELCQHVAELSDEIDELRDYAEELDEDLGAVEDYIMDDLDGEEYDDDEDFELDGDEYYEVECPGCGETVCFDESIDPEDLTCPACGEKFTYTDDDEEDE